MKVEENRKLPISYLFRSYFFVEYVMRESTTPQNPAVNLVRVLYFGIFFKKLYLLYIGMEGVHNNVEYVLHGIYTMA
jgi:hypothetical protein